jgi:hypothetical protein
MSNNKHAYIYLLQSGEYINTNVYKIGKTVQNANDTRVLNRIKSYSSGTIVYNLYHIHNSNHINQVENEIIHLFRTKYILVTGREWFQGNVIDMKLDIDSIINKYNSMPPDYNDLIPSYSNSIDTSINTSIDTSIDIYNTDSLNNNIDSITVTDNNNNKKYKLLIGIVIAIVIVIIIIIS